MLYKTIAKKDISKFYEELETFLLDGWTLTKNSYGENGWYMAQLVKPEPKPLEIKVKYFDPEIIPIQKITEGDWVDLRSAERVALKKGDYYLFRLGVGMILPTGYEALVLPRSSTPSKFGIVCANSMGVIDNSYSGDGDEWRFPAVAIRDTIIEKNDRICQFRILKNQPEILFTTVEHLNEVSRGGIGSTGKR